LTPTSDPPLDEGLRALLQGDGRYALRRRLGAGSFGSVYEVFDHELAAVLALKVLDRTDPGSIYRFKQEFRELAEVSHPNLVRLHELTSRAERWFFTMELVDGTDFLPFVRGSYVPVESDLDAAPTASVLTEARATPTAATGVVQALAAVDTAQLVTKALHARGELVSSDGLARLRVVLPQLVSGVRALHRAGKLHRDLKPTNVRVTTDERVVVTDFGLVLPLARHAVRTVPAGAAGPPASLAPEQAACDPIDEAADWYAVGVMLFEALTGTRPFARVERERRLELKRRIDGPAPSEVVAGVPEDLDRLCVELLRADPRARPRGDEIARRVGAPQGDAERRVALPARIRPQVGIRRPLARFPASPRGPAGRRWGPGTSGREP